MKWIKVQIIINPPFGIDWKREQKAVEAEAKKGELGRFAPGLPKISDGQQLFVLNGLSKLAHNGKMAIVQNGSPLFSGDAGSGPSEIRRYILENDWLDAIIQLSTDMFMNTGISTYIWVLNKNKPDYRAGKVQLIDASHCGEQRRKSIGFKRYDITDLCRELIVKAYGEFKSDEIYGDKNGVYCHSKIFDNEEFGYKKIVVERPIRYKYTITREAIERVIDNINRRRTAPAFESMQSLVIDALSLMSALDIDNPDNIREDVDKLLYEGAVALAEMEGREFMSLSELETAFNNSRHITDKKKHCWKYFEKVAGISASMRSVCPDAEIYYDSKGKSVADSSKRDTENVPLREDINEYFTREVLPYAPDAWIDTKKTKVGYEIPMTRYFYEYQAPEKVEDIMSRLSGIEADIQASLAALFGGDK